MRQTRGSPDAGHERVPEEVGGRSLPLLPQEAGEGGAEVGHLMVVVHLHQGDQRLLPAARGVLLELDVDPGKAVHFNDFSMDDKIF